MKGGYVYTLVFTFIVSVVFTAFLAGANEIYLPQIRQNQDTALKKAVLYALGVNAESDAQALDYFGKNIREEKKSDMNVFVMYAGEGNPSGYAVPFTGPGLWGTIQGYMGVSADLQRVLGISFTVQSETPGLGGRIDEPWFKEQFREIAIGSGTKIAYGEADGKEVDAVTGATITSNSVLKILNETIEKKLPELGVEK